MLNRLSSLVFKATLILVGISLFQLSANAQKQEEQRETTVLGQTAMAWMTYGELIRFRAFNPAQTDSGRANESINVQIRLFDERGALLRETPTVVIPPGEFRWIDIKREDLNVVGDPSTGRVQVRTQALWGIRSQTRLLHVPTSLDLVDQNTGAGTFRFYLIVEALP
jgi:hypothetical protein